MTDNQDNSANRSEKAENQRSRPAMKSDALEPRILLSGTWIAEAPEPPEGPTDGPDTFQGGARNDVARGLGGNDLLLGNGGNDRLFGDDGDDGLFGGTGRDRLEGGSGDDLLDGGSSNDRLYGGEGDDGLFGGSGRDRLEGGSGDDLLDGGSGNDRLYGGEGDDRLSGDTGVDILSGEDGDDVLFGGDSNDRLYGGEGDDTLDGGAGADRLVGDAGDDRLSGGDGNDRIYGGIGEDTLDGGTGNDRLYGGIGEDTLDGGTGNDRLYGGSGEDVILGGTGNDALYGGKGNDQLIGEAGNDILRGEGGDDELLGGEGNDRLRGDEGDDTLDGGDGNDRLIGNAGNDELLGGDGNDRLYGGTGEDTLFGAGGNDTLYGGSGNDNLQGDVGNDRLQGDAGDDTLAGGVGNDRLKGGSGDDILLGGADNDRLEGGAGDDILAGQSGDDVLIGGGGHDVADYRPATAGVRVDLTTTRAQNTLGAGVDTLRSLEGVIGSDHNDTFAFTRPRIGAVYHVDGHGGSNAIDLTRFDSSEVTVTEDTITVQMRADGRGFQIHYQNVGEIILADQAVNAGPPILPPELEVLDATGYEDRAIPLDLSASLGDTDTNQTLTVTIRGLPLGAALSAGVNHGDGSWTLTPDQLDGLLFTPPEDASGPIDLTVEATVTNAVSGQSATARETLLIDVTPVVDAPSLNVTDAHGVEDSVIPLDISSQLGDLDGSESLRVTIRGVPEGAWLSAGANNGDGSWTLTADELDGLAITPPLDFSGSIDLTVEATASEDGAAIPPISFSDNDIMGYGGSQDQGGVVTVEDGGRTLHLVGNTWKKIDFPYEVTSDTVLQFDFLSTNEGEIHAIGFDVDDQIDSSRAFKLFGTQDWGRNEFDVYNLGDGWQRVRIPVGQSYTGQQQNLFFVSDHDVSGSTAESYFRDVQIFEGEGGAGDGTATVTRHLRITATPVADMPTLVVTDVIGDEDTAIPLQIGAHVTDADGSETLTVTIRGVPEGAVLSAGVDNGDGSWTLSVDDLDGLSLRPPQDFSGSLVLDVEATSVEQQVLPTALDFSEHPALGYGGSQDQGGTATVEDGGNTLHLSGNTWKKIEFPYEITSETVLEFDFLSTHRGEIHGIGFDNDDAITSDYTFKLFGTQSWGLEDLEPYQQGDGWQHFRIPVGEYYTGHRQNLFFVNDHDIAGSNADSLFRNVQVFEEGVPPQDVGPAASNITTLEVTVSPVADIPVLTVADATGAEDTAVPLIISAHGSDSDGSETLWVEIRGVPEGSWLSAGINNGDGSWTLNSNQLDDLSLRPPRDFHGPIDLTVEAVSAESDGGDPASVSRTLHIDLSPVDDSPKRESDFVPESPTPFDPNRLAAGPDDFWTDDDLAQLGPSAVADGNPGSAVDEPAGPFLVDQIDGTTGHRPIPNLRLGGPGGADFDLGPQPLELTRLDDPVDHASALPESGEPDEEETVMGEEETAPFHGSSSKLSQFWALLRALAGTRKNSGGSVD